jgi:hypothetical protein
LSEPERNELFIERGTLLGALVDSVQDVRARHDELKSDAVLLADHTDERGDTLAGLATIAANNANARTVANGGITFTELMFPNAVSGHSLGISGSYKTPVFDPNVKQPGAQELANKQMYGKSSILVEKGYQPRLPLDLTHELYGNSLNEPAPVSVLNRIKFLRSSYVLTSVVESRTT